MNENPSTSSPTWGLTSKLIVGLSMVAIIAWLLIKFQNLIGPLILVFLLAYILYPVAKHLSRLLKLPWRLAVSLIYLVFIILIISLLTLGGLALVNQLQSLIDFLQSNLAKLPAFLQNLSQQVIQFGPFQFSLAQVNIDSLTNQILSSVQPLLGQVGSLLGIVASSAASLVGWIFFIILVSYFILVESSGIPTSGFRIRIPGYDADIKRMGDELSHIWNSFIRGQVIIISITVVVYAILLGSYGLPFYLGLAAIAGFARFIPYIGPLIMWTTYGLVAYFKGSYPFGLDPWIFVIIVDGSAMLVDSIIDNLISPRIMGQTLKVHPAAVLISALVAVSIIGLIGVLVAAPILATVKLVFGYIFRKMLDQDPWEGLDLLPVQTPNPIYRRIQRAGHYLIIKISRFWKRFMRQVQKFCLIVSDWIRSRWKQFIRLFHRKKVGEL
jgi:predicted PurR-regulated permease PerM